MSLADSLTATSSRPVALRRRPDLTVTRQRYQGRDFYVVKEPLSLKYFRFQEEEYAILGMLDGRASLDDIKSRFGQQFAPQKIGLRDLENFLGMLHRGGLVIADAPGQGKALKRRRDENRRKQLFATLSNILAIRFKGVDPDRFLTKTYPLVRPIFTWAAFAVWLALLLGAASLILGQYDQFESRLPGFYEFFGPSNWLWFALVLSVVKVIHKLGHGYTCKHFGGACHEIGLMFLVLTPCLYCNTSDSWLLPNKWARAGIGAAGIFVELTLAALATYIWWFSHPGLVNHLALQVMFVCSVSTILFNGNPLLRYDGYYVLSDVLEIPNLRQKAGKVLSRFMAHACLGIKPQPDPFLPNRGRVLFGLYTVASNIYRWVVVISILWFLNEVFEPMGLKPLGQIIAAMSLIGLVGTPLFQINKYLTTPGRMDQVKSRNVWATAAVVLLVAGVVGLLPFPRYTYCPVYLELQDGETVYVETAGVLREVSVQPGDRVQAGQTLARLENFDLLLEKAELLGRRAELAAQWSHLQRQRAVDSTAAGTLGITQASLNTVEEQLAEGRAKLAALALCAPADGTVVPPPVRPTRHRNTQLPEWSGTPLMDRNLGMLLAESDVFCRIGDPTRLEARLVIDQRDIEDIHPDQTVRIRLAGFPELTLVSIVSGISRGQVEIAPPGLSNSQGGELATRTDKEGVTRPLSTSYYATAPINKTDESLRVGLQGTARIHTGYETLLQRFYRGIMRTFHFEL